MAFEQVWSEVQAVAALHGYQRDPKVTDDGLRIYQSKWKTRTFGFGNTERTRVRAEVERPKDKPTGWLVRFYVERQTVKDFAKAMDPEEKDWSSNGQHKGVEELMDAQLRRRLALETGG